MESRYANMYVDACINELQTSKDIGEILGALRKLREHNFIDQAKFKSEAINAVKGELRQLRAAVAESAHQQKAFDQLEAAMEETLRKLGAF